MIMLLEGKTAIITGSAKGIGRAVALKFAREGANLVLADLDQEALEITKTDIVNQTGVKAIAVRADVSKEKDVLKTVEVSIEHFGSIEVLINNAGIQPPKKPFYQISMEEWDHTFAVNLRSIFLFSKSVVPSMIKQGGGNIIHTSSVCESVYWEGSLHYIASKGSIRHLTGAMALEMAPHKIRVNAVSPGVVDTDLNKDTLSAPGARDQHAESIPLRRLSVPDDLAGAYAFLASEKSEYITGQVIVVDGGFSLL